MTTLQQLPDPGTLAYALKGISPSGRTVVGLAPNDRGLWCVLYSDGTHTSVGPSITAAAEVAVETSLDEAGGGSSWSPLDLTAYLNGQYVAPVPTLLKRSDGHGLIYPGRVHWCSGEPGSFKSYFGLHGSALVLHQGGSVVYIDFEDGPGGITSRLLALGVDPAAIATRFTYISPDAGLRYSQKAALTDVVADAELVIIDACTEALAAQGLSSKDDTDIAAWLSLLPRWAAKLGPAVLVIDHVVKDTESRGRWSSGSGHKLAGLDGAAFTIENVQPGGVGLLGRSRVFVSKDRHGQVEPLAVPTGGKRWVADFIVDSSGPWTEAVLHPPTIHDGPFIPTVVMAKVSDVLAKAGQPLSKAILEGRVQGRAAVVRQAIAELEALGHVLVEKGPNNSRLHTLIKAYPEVEA